MSLSPSGHQCWGNLALQLHEKQGKILKNAFPKWFLLCQALRNTKANAIKQHFKIFKRGWGWNPPNQCGLSDPFTAPLGRTNRRWSQGFDFLPGGSIRTHLCGSSITWVGWDPSSLAAWRISWISAGGEILGIWDWCGLCIPHTPSCGLEGSSRLKCREYRQRIKAGNTGREYSQGIKPGNISRKSSGAAQTQPFPAPSHHFLPTFTP